jgi:hypothetical protein
MSLPFSFGDLVAVVQLFEWVRRNCINPESNAQGKYLEFKRQIDGLEKVINDFQDAFLQAIGHVNDDDLLDAVRRHEALIQQANTLLGDFMSTLTECQTLLIAHVKFDKRKGSFFDNTFWYSSTQAKVDELRQRIQTHGNNISLFLQPVMLQLETETVTNTRDIRELLMANAGLAKKAELRNIPSSLDGKFRDALSRHPTIQISNPSKIPLKEGVDVMLLHYRESTAKSHGSVSKQQYLHLLKTHWLVETLSKSDALKQTKPGHLYCRLVERVRKSVAEQYQREELVQYIDQPWQLNASDSDIWPRKVMIPEPQLMDPMGREEMLARLPVASQSPNEKREIFVFKIDDRNLRIVYLRSSSEPTQRIKETETFFDLYSDRLVPLYAIATGPRTEWSMQMFYGSGAAQADYPLQTRSDAFKLQQAFIGYEVTAFSESISCFVTHKRTWPIRSGLHGSDGEVQLLQWPVPTPIPSCPSSPISPLPNGTINSRRSSSNYTKASWAFRNTNPILTSISEAESDKTVVVTALPPSPLIMAFTKCKSTGTYTFWQIERKRKHLMNKLPF